jgi:hypothetical protein
LGFWGFGVLGFWGFGVLVQLHGLQVLMEDTQIHSINLLPTEFVAFLARNLNLSAIFFYTET